MSETNETTGSVTLTVAQYEALRSTVAPEVAEKRPRPRRHYTWFQRLGIASAVVLAVLIGMAILGANLPDPSTTPSAHITSVVTPSAPVAPVAPVAPSVTHPACPVGSMAGWTWTTTEYATGSTCEATRTVHGVTITYVINSDGTSLAGYAVDGTCSDAGLDMSKINGGYFAGVDCQN